MTAHGRNNERFAACTPHRVANPIEQFDKSANPPAAGGNGHARTLADPGAEPRGQKLVASFFAYIFDVFGPKPLFHQSHFGNGAPRQRHHAPFHISKVRRGRTKCNSLTPSAPPHEQRIVQPTFHPSRFSLPTLPTLLTLHVPLPSPTGRP